MPPSLPCQEKKSHSWTFYEQKTKPDKFERQKKDATTQ